MSTTNLMNETTFISDGLDGIIMPNNYTSKRGGVSLDVTGYPLPNIRAGHVIIKESAGTTFKPMPIVITGAIASLGSFAPGSGYTNNGTYNNVALTGGSGSGATANIVVAGNVVTSVTLVTAGTGYKAGDLLSAAAANIGTGGSGFAVSVLTLSSTNAVYGSLPGGYEYYGHAVQSVLTKKAMVGVSYHGEINNLVVDPSKGVFDLSSILTALKEALPHMMYKGDNA